MWVLGQNPLVTNPNLRYVREAFAKLEFLVVQELWETETAAFWQAPGVDPKAIQTEVILLPAAYFMEKEGSITNSGAMVQWRNAGVKPPGEARADLVVIDEVFRRVRALYAELDRSEGRADPEGDVGLPEGARSPRTCSRRSTAAPAWTSPRRG